MAWIAKQGISIKDICNQKLIQNRLRHCYIGSKMYSRAGQCTRRCVYGSLWVVSMCRCGLEVV